MIIFGIIAWIACALIVAAIIYDNAVILPDTRSIPDARDTLKHSSSQGSDGAGTVHNGWEG